VVEKEVVVIAFTDWLKAAAKYIYDKDGLTGLAHILVVILAFIITLAVVLSYTSMGLWLARLFGV
jgi:hypothetical protein